MFAGYLEAVGHVLAERDLPAVRAYDVLELHRDDPVGNAARATGLMTTRELAKLGRPTDRDEFFSLAQALDAFGLPHLVALPPLAPGGAQPREIMRRRGARQGLRANGSPRLLRGAGSGVVQVGHGRSCGSSASFDA
jgi:hypothetical protein